jgi:hypothetical protein
MLFYPVMASLISPLVLGLSPPTRYSEENDCMQDAVSRLFNNLRGELAILGADLRDAGEWYAAGGASWRRRLGLDFDGVH